MSVVHVLPNVVRLNERVGLPKFVLQSIKAWCPHLSHLLLDSLHNQRHIALMMLINFMKKVITKALVDMDLILRIGLVVIVLGSHGT